MSTEQKPIYDRPCSKCGVHVKWDDARNSLGDLADHRLCPVPAGVVGQEGESR